MSACCGGSFVLTLLEPYSKKFFKENSSFKGNSNRHSPPSPSEMPKLKIITKKPIFPSEKELYINSRSRSAKLRVAEKLPQKDKNISEAA